MATARKNTFEGTLILHIAEYPHSTLNGTPTCSSHSSTTLCKTYIAGQEESGCVVCISKFFPVSVACNYFSFSSLSVCLSIYIGKPSIYEELISKTSHLHSYMLLICRTHHSKEANFQHKIYCKWKMLILIKI